MYLIDRRFQQKSEDSMQKCVVWFSLPKLSLNAQRLIDSQAIYLLNLSTVLRVLRGECLCASLRQHTSTWEEVLRWEKLERAAGISSSFPKRAVTELHANVVPGLWSSETPNRCCFPLQICSRPSSHLPYCHHLNCFILLQNSRCFIR